MLFQIFSEGFEWIPSKQSPPNPRKMWDIPLSNIQNISYLDTDSVFLRRSFHSRKIFCESFEIYLLYFLIVCIWSEFC